MVKNKVIVVDDDEDLLKLIVAAFKAKDFDAHGISTGKEALTYLAKEENISSACLLVLDRLLPDMDGLDILKKFQEQFPNRVPILIISVLATENDVIEGLKKGAVDYVTKPFSLPVFMKKALTLIEQ